MSEREFVRYARANLERMFNERILIECENPALYIYGISYKLSRELMNQIHRSMKRIEERLISLLDSWHW